MAPETQSISPETLEHALYLRQLGADAIDRINAAETICLSPDFGKSYTEMVSLPSRLAPDAKIQTPEQVVAIADNIERIEELLLEPTFNGSVDEKALIEEANEYINFRKHGMSWVIEIFQQASERFQNSPTKANLRELLDADRFFHRGIERLDAAKETSLMARARLDFLSSTHALHRIQMRTALLDTKRRLESLLASTESPSSEA